MGGKFVRISLVVLILLASSINLIITAVDAVGTPVVTLKFLEGEEEQSADVRPGELSTVVFPGTVEARLAAGETVQDVIVDLEGYTTNGWNVEILPETIHVDPGGTTTFSATVYVPTETSIYVSETLTLGGTTKTFPGSGDTYDVPPVKGTIRINQFFRYGIECENEEQQAELGEHVTYDIQLTNRGNGKDTYQITIENLEELKAKSISVKVSRPTMEVDEKSTTDFHIEVDISEQSESKGTHEIKVFVKSTKEDQEDGPTYSRTWCLTLEVTGSALVQKLYQYSPLIILIIIVILIVGLVIVRRRRKLNRY